MNTYWVDYSFEYEYLEDDNSWDTYSSSDAGRFQCKKKDILNEVRKRVIEDECLSEDMAQGLKIEINDCYITTDCEI